MQLHGRVLLTGGAGYLGRAIMRQARINGWPCQFTVYSRDELKQAQCKRKYKDAKYVMGDVRETERLALVMVGHDTVIHTAALKYVPEGEHNVSECISVNVNGTQSVLTAARLAGVKRVVVISTDKAVAPTNVYGMTKALCERLVGETVDYESGTIVTAVRYGNVIGSTGSVVPEFERQARECGVVNVTDPEMTRFWMTADDAIELILTALQREPGEIVIGNPMSMALGDLVSAVVPRAKVNIVGLRPGEKMHETLLTEAESMFAGVGVGIGAGNKMYVLPAVSKREAPNPAHYPFEVTSELAEQMNGSEFMIYVEDSHDI